MPALISSTPPELFHAWDRLSTITTPSGPTFCTAAEGSTTLYKADLKGAAAIVIGNEGQGMSRLVSDSCDFKVSIPMKGSISSLNASAAAAIMLYEAVRQRSV